jgi:hypothetical protein
MSGRLRLLNRRRNESFEFEHAGLRFTLCAGFYRDGRIAEIFISSNKPGSPIEAVARDGAILASLCFQHGCDIGTIHAALTKDHNGAAATAIGAGMAALLATEASL